MKDAARHQRIDSARNPRFRAARLLRERKGRSRYGRFLIDGIREIQRALECTAPPVSIVEAFVAVELAQSNEAQALLRKLAGDHIPQFLLPATLWSQLAFGERSDGIVVVAEYPAPVPDSISLGTPPLVVVLEQIEKPGNAGAILRTVDAVGADCVILADGNFDRFGPNAIRASVGTVFSVPVLQMPSQQTLDWLRGRAIQPWLAHPDAPTSFFDVDFRGPTAIVLGSEAAGVSSLWTSAVPYRFHVPMKGLADSLNVSVTAAVVLYEALRQRRGK